MCMFYVNDVIMIVLVCTLLSTGILGSIWKCIISLNSLKRNGGLRIIFRTGRMNSGYRILRREW